MARKELNLAITATDEDLQRVVRQTTRALKNLSRTTKTQSRKTAASFQQASNKMRNAGKKMRQSVLSIKTAILGLATGAVVKAPVNIAGQFGLALAEIDTLLDKSGTSIDTYRKQLLALSKESPKELLDLSKALYQTISAGIPAIEGASGAFGVLEVAQKAAVAGISSTEQSVNAIATVLNGYGQENITATEAADKLLNTVRKGRTTFPQLAQALGTVVPIAAKTGVSLDEVLGTMVSLTKAGINTNRSVTALKSLIKSLAKPTSQTKEAIEEFNKATTGVKISIGSRALKKQGLLGTLRNLTEATGGSTEELAKLFPNVRALLPALVAIGSGFGDAKKNIDAITNSAGTLNVAFGKVDATFDTTFKKFKSTVNVTLVEAGERVLPLLQRKLEELTTFLEKEGSSIGDVFESLVTGLVKFGETVKYWGPIVLTVFKAIFVGTLIKGFIAALTLVGPALLLFKAKAVTTFAAVAASAKAMSFAAGSAAVGGVATGFAANKAALVGMMGKLPLYGALAYAAYKVGGWLGKKIGEGLTDQAGLDARLAALVEKNRILAEKIAQREGFKDVKEQQASRTEVAVGTKLEVDFKDIEAAARDVALELRGRIEDKFIEKALQLKPGQLKLVSETGVDLTPELAAIKLAVGDGVKTIADAEKKLGLKRGSDTIAYLRKVVSSSKVVQDEIDKANRREKRLTAENFNTKKDRQLRLSDFIKGQEDVRRKAGVESAEALIQARIAGAALIDQVISKSQTKQIEIERGLNRLVVERLGIQRKWDIEQRRSTGGAQSQKLARLRQKELVEAEKVNLAERQRLEAALLSVKAQEKKLVETKKELQTKRQIAKVERTVLKEQDAARIANKDREKRRKKYLQQLKEIRAIRETGEKDRIAAALEAARLQVSSLVLQRDQLKAQAALQKVDDEKIATLKKVITLTDSIRAAQVDLADLEFAAQQSAINLDAKREKSRIKRTGQDRKGKQAAIAENVRKARVANAAQKVDQKVRRLALQTAAERLKVEKQIDGIRQASLDKASAGLKKFAKTQKELAAQTQEAFFTDRPERQALASRFAGAAGIKEEDAQKGLFSAVQEISGGVGRLQDAALKFAVGTYLLENALSEKRIKKAFKPVVDLGPKLAAGVLSGLSTLDFTAVATAATSSAVSVVQGVSGYLTDALEGSFLKLEGMTSLFADGLLSSFGTGLASGFAGQALQSVIGVAFKTGSAVVSAAIGGVFKTAEMAFQRILGPAMSALNSVVDTVFDGLAGGIDALVDPKAEKDKLTEERKRLQEQGLRDIEALRAQGASTEEIARAQAALGSRLGELKQEQGKEADAIQSAFDKAFEMLDRLTAHLPALVERFMLQLVEKLPALVTGLVTAFSAVLVTFATNLGPLISTFIASIVDALPLLIDGLITAVPLLISGLMEGLTTLVSELPRIVDEFLRFLIEGLPAIIVTLAESIPELIAALAEAWPVILTRIIGSIPEIIFAIVAEIPAIIVAIVRSVPTIINNIIKGLGGGIANVFKPIVSIFESIKRFFSNIGSGAGDFFTSIGEGFMEVVTLGFYHGGGNVRGGRNQSLASQWRGAGVAGYQTGGMVDRVRNSVRASVFDNVPALLQTGESVLNRAATARLGSAGVDALNKGGSPSTPVNVNVGINPNASGLQAAAAAILPLLVGSIGVNVESGDSTFSRVIDNSQGALVGFRAVPGVR